jgi:hypothetical protein
LTASLLRPLILGDQPPDFLDLRARWICLVQKVRHQVSGRTLEGSANKVVDRQSNQYPPSTDGRVLKGVSLGSGGSQSVLQQDFLLDEFVLADVGFLTWWLWP